jgi:hypothetical protein
VCSATPRYSYWTYYSLGPEIPASSWVTVSPVAAGQGPKPAANDLFQNGTRIQMLLDTSADGLVAPGTRGWNDPSTRGPCNFETALDGQLRCIPYPMDEFVGPAKDPQCSIPIAYAAQGERYGVAINTVGIPVNSYYEIGGLYTGPTYNDLDPTCQGPNPPGPNIHDVVAIPTSTFAGVALGTPTGPFAGIRNGSRLKIKVVSTSDGARGGKPWDDYLIDGKYWNWRQTWFDSQLNVDCLVTQLSDGTARCLPPSPSRPATDFVQVTITP